MATYTIVGKDKDPLGPGEIAAGSEVEVQPGDVFIISSDADDTVKFVAAGGTPASFEIRIDESNGNDFDIEIEEDLSPDIMIADGVSVEEVDFDAKDADSVTLTAGDNVTLGKYEGSEDGADLLSFGDGFTTDEDIKTHGGDDEITIGDNATVDKIETGDGADQITIGHGFQGDEIKTGTGDDAITIGDGATLDDIDTGDGDDTIIAGDDFTADKIETKDGDDTVRIGANGNVDDLDGGKGDDTLHSPTAFPDAENFEETIACFVKGTRIRTPAGDVEIERLRTGDKVLTLDNGVQEVRWIGLTRVSGTGAFAPVRFAAGALGNARALLVSQQHRMLISGWQAELHFGEAQVLVPARHLAGREGIELVEAEQVEYFHLLFDRHEVVLSEGIASESFHPGSAILDGLPEACQKELLALFLELAESPETAWPAARVSLRRHESHVLAA